MQTRHYWSMIKVFQHWKWFLRCMELRLWKGWKLESSRTGLGSFLNVFLVDFQTKGTLQIIFFSVLGFWWQQWMV